MKAPILLTALMTGLLFGDSTLAQENKKTDAPADLAPKPQLNDLEAKFKATMTKCIMSGRWCSVKDGVMGEEREDKYTIQNVGKVSGDDWVITTRIQYGKRDVIAPIPIKVKWAGDTAVIIVDKVPVPGGGVYSARVMVYENTYSGSWTGGDHGGLLNGVITPQ